MISDSFCFILDHAVVPLEDAASEDVPNPDLIVEISDSEFLILGQTTVLDGEAASEDDPIFVLIAVISDEFCFILDHAVVPEAEAVSEDVPKPFLSVVMSDCACFKRDHAVVPVAEAVSLDVPNPFSTEVTRVSNPFTDVYTPPEVTGLLLPFVGVVSNVSESCLDPSAAATVVSLYLICSDTASIPSEVTHSN